MSFEAARLNPIDSLLLIFLLSNCSNIEPKLIEATDKPIEISTLFDRGSMGPMKVINDSLIEGQTMHWIKKESKAISFIGSISK